MYDVQEHHALVERQRLIDNVAYVCLGRGMMPLLAPAIRGGKDWTKVRLAYLNEVQQAVVAAGLDWTAYEKLVSAHVASIRRDFGSIGAKKEQAKNNDTLDRRLRAVLLSDRAPVVQALKAIPSTFEKAQGFASYLLRQGERDQDNAILPDLLQVLASSEARLVSIYRKRHHKLLLAGGSLDGPRYWETEWLISRTRYVERHELAHGKQFLQDACSDIEGEVRQLASSAWAKSADNVPCPDLLSVFRLFWLCSFSHRLRARVEQVVAGFVQVALTWQSANGTWPREAAPECDETTAYAVACLLRFGDGSTWRPAIDRAIAWLSVNVSDAGGWGLANRKGGAGGINLVTTVAVLDAMRIYGVSLDHPAIESAEAALLAAQSPEGGWHDIKGYAEEYLTALVIGYFQRRDQRLSQMHDALEMGRGLLLKAQSMQIGFYATDQMLSLISLFHGLEYVLYGFLSAHEQGIRKSDGKTIGMDEALAQFRKLAQSKSWIGAASDLPFFTDLAELKARRDEVVHRMGRTQPEAVQRFTAAVWKFVERFDVPALGYTLLD